MNIIKKSPNKKAILLINLGTPKSYKNKDIRKYLKEFLSDKRVIELPKVIWRPILKYLILPLRSYKIARLYKKIWIKNKSPLLYYTESQAYKLSKLLKNNDVIVDFSMRYSDPSIKKKIEYLKAKNITDIIIFPLYPQYSSSTTGSVYEEIFRILIKMRFQPNIIGIGPYYKHPAYIDTIKKHILRAIKNISFKIDLILLSFHGIPNKYVKKGDPYKKHCYKTYELIKNALIETKIQIKISFQSRFGRAQWIKPYTTEVLKNLPRQGKKNILVCAPGFASDCLETLEELEEQERQTFINEGGENYILLTCLNDRKEHINMIKDIIKTTAVID